MRVRKVIGRLGSSRVRRQLEHLLIALGLGCLALGAVKVAAPAAYAHAPQLVRSRLYPDTLHSTARLSVPRLGLSTLVLDGPEDAALAVGAAHLRGTPMPGDRGNTVIAGHRDSVFRGLRHIRPGDLVELDAGRVLRYRVDSVKVVSPDDTSALLNQSAPTLTLITCFPFYFVGEAPRRFVVRASLLD